MAKQEGISVQGTVVEALPSAKFNIKLDNDHIVRGHISGKIRKNFIKILPGDRVELEMSPYDLTQGRITFRHK